METKNVLKNFKFIVKRLTTIETREDLIEKLRSPIQNNKQRHINDRVPSMSLKIT